VRDFCLIEAPGAVQLAVWLLCATGQRQGTLLARTVGDWNPDQRILTIPKIGRETTKLKSREFALGPITAAKIDAYLATRPEAQPDELLLEGIYYTQLNRVLKPLGGKPKDCRAWFCGTLERLDCPERTINVLMGHARPKTRRHYTGRWGMYRVEDSRPWLEKVEQVLNGNLDLD